MKKTLLSMAMIILLGLTAVAQNDATLYKIKIEKYKRWQRTGRFLLIGGAALVATGLVITLSDEDGFESAFDGAGGPLMAIGGATIIPGIIFNSIGKTKRREYEMKLEGLQAGLYYRPSHSGIVIRFRF